MLYTSIACTALFIVLITVTSVIGKRGRDQRARNFLPLFEIIVCYAFVSIFVGGVSVNVLELYIPRKLVTNTWELAAMRTTDSTQGSFVFGSGSIGSVMKYDVYVKNENGSVSPFRISAADNVEISEKPDLKNVGYWKRTMRKFDYSNTPWANWVIQHPDAETLVKTELEVPVGTVVHSFAAQ